MFFMRSYRKSFFGSPTINLQLFEILFPFSGLMTQEQPEKLGSLSELFRGSHCWLPQRIHGP